MTQAGGFIGVAAAEGSRNSSSRSSQLSTRFVTCQPSRRAIGSSAGGGQAAAPLSEARRQTGTGPGAESPHYEPGSAPPAPQLKPLNFHCRLTAVTLPRFFFLPCFFLRQISTSESPRPPNSTPPSIFFSFRFEGRMTPTHLMILSR